MSMLTEESLARLEQAEAASDLTSFRPFIAAWNRVPLDREERERVEQLNMRLRVAAGPAEAHSAAIDPYKRVTHQLARRGVDVSHRTKEQR